MVKQAYIKGFLRKCAEHGVSEEEASRILDELGAQFGANGLEDSPENDYGPGVVDAIKNIWTPSEVMAKKQRRFEDDYKRLGGIDKIIAWAKHPVRAARADRTAGAMGLTTASVAFMLANLLAARKGK